MSDTIIPAYPHPIRTEWKLLATLKKDHPDITLEECAKQLGFSAGAVRMWIRTPLYQSYENWFLNQTYDGIPLKTKRERAAVQDDLDEFAQEMLLRLRDIAETSHDMKLVAQIGFDVLDRAGYGAVKKDAARPINLILTPEVVAELRRRTAEIGAGEIIVGETVERVS